MLGAFRSTLACLGGPAWHLPFRMSPTRKANVRKRLKAADKVVDVLTQSGVTCRILERIRKEPKEHEMLSKDKYFTFSRHGRNYRKGVHRVPKFTRVPLPRTMPKGF